MIDGFIITFVKALVLCAVLLGAFAYMTVIERKILGRMQHRYGPNRVGPFGLLQPIADAIKSIFKEDIVVTASDRFVYFIAPFISILFALSAFGAIPAGPAGSLFGLIRGSLISTLVSCTSLPRRVSAFTASF